MLNKTFCILIKLSWELYLLVEGHFKYLIRILSHKRRPSIKTLINENAKGIPVNWRMIAFVLNDFRSDILRSSTEGISPVSWHKSLDKTKIRKLYVPILLDQHVLWLQVSINQIF